MRNERINWIPINCRYTNLRWVWFARIEFSLDKKSLWSGEDTRHNSSDSEEVTNKLSVRWESLMQPRDPKPDKATRSIPLLKWCPRGGVMERTVTYDKIWVVFRFCLFETTQWHRFLTSVKYSEGSTVDQTSSGTRSTYRTYNIACPVANKSVRRASNILNER